MKKLKPFLFIFLYQQSKKLNDLLSKALYRNQTQTLLQE
jgi:hypothetical protein